MGRVPRISRIVSGAMLLAAAAAMTIPPAVAGPAEKLRAFSVPDIPADDAKALRFFSSLRDAGADTVIVGPLREKGQITKRRVPHIVFLAHRARLKIHFILPVRTDREALDSHPEWEDRRYDAASGTLQPSGTLNLFHPGVSRYLSDAVKSLASFFVDGIVLGDDLPYAEAEGFGEEMFEAYRRTYGSRFEPRRAFLPARRTGGEQKAGEYGEDYGRFSRLRQERLAAFVNELRSAARSVNPDITMAVPVRFQGYRDPFAALAVYTREVKAFRAADPDFFWIAIPHRESEGLNYKEGMQALARSVTMISQAIPGSCRAVVFLPLINPAGRMLAPTEIEESADMARRGGDPCIVYQTRHDRALYHAVMQKLLRRE